MELFFTEPDEAPKPPEEVRIRDFQVKPMTDKRRIQVYLEVDPFQFTRRPNADLRIEGPDGQTRATASIIESMTRRMEVTLHLRGETPPGSYTAHAILYYTQPIERPEPDAEPAPAPEPVIEEIDRRDLTFHL